MPPELHSLRGRADSLISVLSQMPAKPKSNTSRTNVDVAVKGFCCQICNWNRHLTDTQTFNTVNSIFKQLYVDPSGPVKKPVWKNQKTQPLPQAVVFFRTKPGLWWRIHVGSNSTMEHANRKSIKYHTREAFHASYWLPYGIDMRLFCWMKQELNKRVTTSHQLGDKKSASADCNCGRWRQKDYPDGGHEGQRQRKVIPKVSDEESREDEKLGSKTELLFGSDKAQGEKPEK